MFDRSSMYVTTSMVYRGAAENLQGTSIRAYLSQCKLVFRSRPDDFVDDQVKTTYAVSWPTATAYVQQGAVDRPLANTFQGDPVN